MPTDLDALLQGYLQDQDADGYLFSGPINSDTADEIVSVIEHQDDRRLNACFFLTTGGGDPHCAYRIGRTLKRCYPKGDIRFLFGGYCKSAGTLLALCANEFIFSSFGELGPLDIQIGKLNELVGADSGLDLNQALEQLGSTAFASFEAQLLDIVRRSQGSISTKVAADIATELTVGLFSPISAQIDPLRLGVSWRSNQIGLQYGHRLASKSVRGNALSRLVNSYPTHGFVIDEGEASQLFENVRHADSVEQEIFDELRWILRKPNDEDKAVILALRTDLRSADQKVGAQQPATSNENIASQSDASASNGPEGNANEESATVENAHDPDKAS